MLITTIESQLRRITGASTSQYSQADFLIDINVVKDEFWSAIVWAQTDRNYDIWAVDSTTLISEYTMPEVASDTAWSKILKNIAINYTWDTYTETWLPIYIPAREVSPDSLKHQWNYYVENQSTDDPIYYISDNSYFIAPAFREASLSNRIQLTWIKKIADYTISTTEADLKIPVDYQRVLLWGCIPYALMSKRVENNEIQKAQNDYINEKTIAIQNMTSRREWPITMLYPDQQEENNFIIWA